MNNQPGFAEAVFMDNPDNTSTFTWTPTYNAVKKTSKEYTQDFEIQFKATDNKDVVTETATIVVNYVNRAPKITQLEDIIVNETDTVVIEPVTEDPDEDELSYEYSGWMTSNTKETGYEDEGTHLVTVTVSDGVLSDSKAVVVKVLNKNRAPIFKNIEKQTVNEDETVTMKVKAKDFDGDFIEYKTTTGLKGSEMENDTFEWTPSRNVVMKQSSLIDKLLSKVPFLNRWFSSTQESYYVEFIASDGQNIDVESGTITVKDMNRGPKITAIKPNATIILTEGDTVEFGVLAEDLDGNNLTYTWDFGINEKYEGENVHTRKYTIAGEKKAKVTVSDGVEEDSFEWTIFVQKAEVSGTGDQYSQIVKVVEHSS